VPSVGAKAVWQPHHLARVLDYLPENTPLGIYGRGPNWLYAALVLQSFPEPFYQFDARLGWVAPPSLHLGQPASLAFLEACVSRQPHHAWIEFRIPVTYLDYDEALDLTVPEPLPGQGVVLSGKLAHWLYTALTLTYIPHVSWLAIYHPPLDRAIVVGSSSKSPAPGDLIEPPSVRAVWEAIGK
jgi:CRISPR-associated protein Csx3